MFLRHLMRDAIRHASLPYHYMPLIFAAILRHIFATLDASLMPSIL